MKVLNLHILFKENAECLAEELNTGVVENLNDIQENEIINQIKNKQLIDKYVKNGKIVKTIYVKNRLINYIVKS